MNRNRTTFAAVAVLAVAATLAGAAPAMAADGKGDPVQALASAQAQNARLSGIPKAFRAATIRQQVISLRRRMRRVLDQLEALRGDVDSIRALVPVVASSLTQLGDGLRQLAAGTQQLGTAYSAVEYGVIGLFNGSTRVTTLTSADIPDDGNAVTVSGSVPFQATGGEVLTIKAAIKSGETDGTGPSDPAGQVGGILYATCATPTPLGPGCPAPALGALLAPGTLACNATPATLFEIAGPPSLHVFDLPDGSSTKQTLEDVPFKYSRTNSSVPQFSDTNAAGDGSPDPNSCTLPSAGVYNLSVSASFVDIPTSLSPGPSD